MMNNPQTESPAAWSAPSDQRTISELRLIIAMAAALGVALESSLPILQQGIAYALALAYALTSVFTLWVVNHRPGWVRASVSYWLDAGWLILLLATVGPESNLFVLLLFPVMLASFQSGFIQGMAVTLLCVTAYSALSAWSPVSGNMLSAAFGSIVALAVLGYMSARWGDNVVRFKRRLGLLSAISAADAQLGETGVLLKLLDNLRQFARASRVVAMVPEAGDDHSTLYEIGATDSRVDRVPNGIVREFLDLPPALIAGYNRHSPSRLLRPRFSLYDTGQAGMVQRSDIPLGQLADLLATRHYQCFPLPVGQGGETGRVCLCYDRRFRVPVAYAFLHQVAVQIALRLDNLRLVNRLTATAATGERRRISRDLHDSTVQPYVGLRMGLEALKRKTGTDNPLHDDISDLIAMADASIAQLRGYIVTLRGQAGHGGGHVLPALHAQVEQFEAHSGIRINLDTQGDQALSEHQLDEFRHIVSEGLSNIRRHGRCEHATVRLDCTPDSLVLEFINPADFEVGPFHPRSLSERARELGGRMEVIRSVENTRVRVTLPVWSRQPAGSAA
jgi:signal transduction histidine kinase